MNYKYLIDSNVLSTSEVIDILDTDFFRENCIVISEVAYELFDTIVSEKVAKHIVTPTVNTLTHLKTIVDDLVKLEILKTDHGNGEAMLLAEALSMKAGDKDQISLDFMRDRPVIVTNEKSVDAYAKSIGIEAVNGKEFIKIVTSVTNTH